MAESEETVPRAAGYLPLATRANEDLSEIRMTDRHILAEVTYSVAVRTIRIAKRRAAGVSRG